MGHHRMIVAFDFIKLYYFTFKYAWMWRYYCLYYFCSPPPKLRYSRIFKPLWRLKYSDVQLSLDVSGELVQDLQLVAKFINAQVPYWICSSICMWFTQFSCLACFVPLMNSLKYPIWYNCYVNSCCGILFRKMIVSATSYFVLIGRVGEWWETSIDFSC